MCATPLNQRKIINKDLLSNALNNVLKYKKIEENYQLAHELIPESFFHVDMLYIKCSINEKEIKALVDTGAQISVMSKDCAERCEIADLIDDRVKEKMEGVGEKTALGKIWVTDIVLERYSLPCSFTVVDGVNFDLIFGLDMLKKHNFSIDFKNNCMKVDDCIIPFTKS